jgi:hypothetical protein
MKLTGEQIAHKVPLHTLCVVVEDPAQSAARHAKDAEGRTLASADEVAA